MLEMIDCEKKYNGKRILWIPSLTLEKGIHWLQGTNGSGKTTLLRMITGLVPFTGDIRLEGNSLRTDRLSYRRQISLAEAEPLYPSFMTGQDLVQFYQHIRQATSEELEQLMIFFRLETVLSAPIATYSSGMLKKLSLLLAFIGKPSLILLDEPLANLDEESIGQIPILMSKYELEYGCSFIFSSHQSIEASDISIKSHLAIVNQSIQRVA